MSEIIVSPGQVSTGPLGLSIVGEGAVRVSQISASAPVIVTGSSLDDAIQVIKPKSAASIYQVNSGAGDDIVLVGAANDTISSGDGNDVIQANGGNDIIDAGTGDDTVFGGAGNDNIQAGDGIDIVDAGLGDDLVRGEQGNDTLFGGPGDDMLYGDEGNDTIIGGDGDDDLFGGANSDLLRGGSGNDILDGGAGRDLYRGGPGSDVFVFGAGSTGVGQLDRILDFRPGEDEIKLSRALLPGSGLGSELGEENFAVVREIGSGGASSAALIYESKTGIVYYNAPGGKDVPLFQMQANLSSLSAADFTLT